MPQRTRHRQQITPLALLACLLITPGCSSIGDFGRRAPVTVTDDIHTWAGQEAAINAGAPVSINKLTEEEHTLRDLAFPLIEPPYDRQRWDAIVYEYGTKRDFQRELMIIDITAYYQRLQGGGWRSSIGRYNRLIDDIRNDADRVPQFADVAHRVIDLDVRREQSLHVLADLSPADRANALARIGENNLTIAWVQRSLAQRCAGYRFALDHLVAAEPERVASQADVALALLQQRLAAYQIEVPLPGLAPVNVAARQGPVTK
jgi:hypothetical protein